MNSYKEKLKSRRSIKAIVAKIEIPGAILWVRKYKTGSVSLWSQPKKGEYKREAKPILQKWASTVGAEQGELTWWVHADKSSLALKKLFQLEGAKIIELNLLKLSPFIIITLPFNIWVKKLSSIRNGIFFRI